MDFDSLPDDAAPQPAAAQPVIAKPSDNSLNSASPASFDSMQDDGDKYGGVGNEIKTGLEGAAQGVLGPIATGAERMLGNVPRADILGREKANPISHDIGEGLGLVGSSVAGVGEGAVMSGAGHMAAEAAGLGNVAKDARLSYKIGAEAVKQAAEMAVLQGSDEASKMILKDPDTSTESAISNVGLAAALGGVGGAALTGIVSPLWSATGGKAVDAILGGLKGHLNGGEALVLPEHIAAAFKDLGVEPSPIMNAALSGDKAAVGHFQDLMRAEHPEVMEELKSLPENLQKAVSDKMGVDLDDTLHFSNAKNGDAIREKFIDKVDADYGPIKEKLDAQRAEANKIGMDDDSRLNLFDKIQEASLGEKVGVNSPYFKEYQQLANQVLDKSTVGGIDQLSEDLGKTARAQRGIDPVRSSALQDMKGILDEFKDAHIERMGTEAAGKEGANLSAQAIAERKWAKAEYAGYAQKYNSLLDNLGMRDFKGTGTMKAQLADLTSEQLLKKFTTKGDVQAQRYLVQEFPEIAQMVKEHEAKDFLSKSVKDVAGDTHLDINGLSRRMADLKKGSPEHLDWVMSPEAQSKIQSAKVLQDALKAVTGIRNSGTPAGMAKIFRHMGSSALSAVATVAGHNPIGGYLMGELAQHLGKTAPEAIKLAMLKNLGSAQPVKAEGFKAMVDMIHHTMKGESALAQGAKAVFKAGAQVAAVRPDQAMRDKLDKKVVALQQTPGKIPQLADGSHLGHYMPEHQAALTQAQVRATQYLQSIKPQPYRASAMDKEIAPTPAKIARYNRALDIASSPNIILQHIKDGTLQSTDIQDLHAMYPALAKNMAQKLTNEMTNAHHGEEMVPYRTRQSLAMFLGTPVDSSMTPSSIMAAQPQTAQPPPQSPQGSKMKGGAKTASTMNKNAESYRTPAQAGEAGRTSRD